MFKKIKNEIKDFWCDYRISMAAPDQPECELEGWRLRIYLFILPVQVFCWTVYHHWITRLICRVRDHEWECDDFATPDSGYMGAHCKRCGCSFGTYLY